MENVIKGLGLLTDIKQADIDKMEHAGLMHRRHARLSFKIKAYTETTVEIQVVQAKNPAGNHYDKKRLIEIVHETFDQFFPGRKIHVQPIPYEENPVDQVNAEWVNKRMLDTGTRLKDIAQDTGINYTALSSLINGKKPLSQITKALFYYYFNANK